ncbi:MAG TPA: phosphatase domain-containing protein [Chitinophagaceae bacterium]|nr:phosphatase domain-containing protein [Chitinophagaceae bacterium]
MKWLRLTNEPTVRVYHGYAQPGKMFVFGHVLGFGPLPRKKYRKNVWTNTFALLRSFMVKPVAGASVRLMWEGKWIYSKTEDDGFFKFEWDNQRHLENGWHEVTVEYLRGEEIAAKGKGTVFAPPENEYGFISDIDDTFLISHSASILKRLYVLLTKNAHSRKPFEGVVRHYQLLAKAATTGDEQNPFFYVSSSEWNLYSFIKEFCRKNELPEGIFLLNQIKRLSQAWKTGKTKHATKFMRIARIIEAYPNQRFILLGDSSQQDPVIYSSIVEHFPKQIHAVYIRDVHEANQKKVRETLIRLEQAGVPCCFFKHSSEAIDHSARIGLIAKEAVLDVRHEA